MMGSFTLTVNQLEKMMGWVPGSGDLILIRAGLQATSPDLHGNTVYLLTPQGGKLGKMNNGTSSPGINWDKNIGAYLKKKGFNRGA